MLNSNLSQLGAGSSEPSALFYRPIRLEWVSRMPCDFLLEKEGLLSAGRYLFGEILPLPKTTAGPPCLQRVTNSPCVLRLSAENPKLKETAWCGVVMQCWDIACSFRLIWLPGLPNHAPDFAGRGSAQPRRKTGRRVTAGTNHRFPSENGGGHCVGCGGAVGNADSSQRWRRFVRYA